LEEIVADRDLLVEMSLGSEALGIGSAQLGARAPQPHLIVLLIELGFVSLLGTARCNQAHQRGSSARRISEAHQRQADLLGTARACRLQPHLERCRLMSELIELRLQPVS
jgi:hypothetical protein